MGSGQKLYSQLSMWTFDCKWSRILLAGWLLCGIAEAKTFLGPGETLNYGEFLLSENGTMQMGFDEVSGVLRIKNLATGNVLWHPRISSWTSTYNGDDICRSNYHSPFNLHWFNVDAPGPAWGSFQDTGEVGLLFKPTPYSRSLSIKGYQLYVRDSKGKAIWHTEPVPYTYPSAAGASTAPTFRELTVTTAFLHLDNNGRAMLLGANESLPEAEQEPFLVWCSCPYCLPVCPLKVDFNAGPSQKWRTNVTMAEYLVKVMDGMLSHAATMNHYREGAGAAPQPQGGPTVSLVQGSAAAPAVCLVKDGKTGLAEQAQKKWLHLHMSGHKASGKSAK